jgi:hypothetical protein
MTRVARWDPYFHPCVHAQHGLALPAHPVTCGDFSTDLACVYLLMPQLAAPLCIIQRFRLGAAG